MTVLLVGFLVGIGLMVAGTWVFRVGHRNDDNSRRHVGAAMFIVGLVAVVPGPAILFVLFLWASGGSYYGL